MQIITEKERTINEKDFDIVISPAGKNDGGSLEELWRYRDLILLLVRRDFVAGYKQTILGPAWAIVQPLVSTLMAAIVFGGLAGLSPDGIPVFLFYMIGQLTWGYFSGCVSSTSGVFVENAYLMGKVYFPRLAIPIASCLSRLISLGIQLAMFTIVYIICIARGASVRPDMSLILLPLYIAHLTVLGLGAGAILSSLTTKYRDTLFLISYGLTAWMYISPVVYDVEKIPDRWLNIYMLNPFASVMEHVRYAAFGRGGMHWNYYLISLAFTLIIFIFGTRVFNKVQRTVLDTI